MARPQRWNTKPVIDGVWEVELSSWKYFHDFVRQEMLDYAQYVWRGQRDSQWKLESSLDRVLRSKSAFFPDSTQRARDHLAKFKLAIRGRRGSNPARIEDENEWWALGQHQALATPLLDWTESPFVALYFAFEKAVRPSNGLRSVWALGPIGSANRVIIADHKAAKPQPTLPPATLDIVRPHQDENSRLVSQAGLFTRAPLGETVDDWVKRHYAGKEGATLIKLSIPELGRTECLRTLNKMNINHLTLFPDLYGAGVHCNKALEIDKY